MKERSLFQRQRLTKHELVLSLLVAAVVIIIGVSLGRENNKAVPVNPSATAHYNLEYSNHLNFMVNWDGPIYLNLAQNGYTSKGQANFFPLYPLAVRIVHEFVQSMVYSGLIVAWACFAGAIYFYIKIIKQFFDVKDNTEALRAALFFILFPTGVFLIATYTESLFALLALGAIYYALKKQYVPAAMLAMLSTATHVNGLFVVVLIGLLMLEEKVKLTKVAATVVTGSLGIVAYMTYQAAKFDNPLAFLEAQKKHSWLNFSPWHLVSEFATLNGIFMLLLIASVIYWWQRRKSFSVYSFLYLCIIFVGGRDLSGVGRYALMAFPIQLMLYDYFRKKPLGYALAIAFTSMLWTFFALRYTGGYTGG